MSDDVPVAAMVIENPDATFTPRPDPKPGDRGFIGGLPPTEVRRIRARARRYVDGHHAEFMADARLRMYEHALKLEVMARYAEDLAAASACAAAYRKAVLDIVAMHTPEKKKAK